MRRRTWVLILSGVWLGSAGAVVVALWRAGRALHDYESRTGVADRQESIASVSEHRGGFAVGGDGRQRWYYDPERSRPDPD